MSDYLTGAYSRFLCRIFGHLWKPTHSDRGIEVCVRIACRGRTWRYHRYDRRRWTTP